MVVLKNATVTSKMNFAMQLSNELGNGKEIKLKLLNQINIGEGDGGIDRHNQL